MAPTMLVGSFIAGSTSVGGGAVAFPVMTLVLDIDPPIARDFSLMIQSVGMGAASIAIVLMGIRVQWTVVIWANLGGLLGIAIGYQIAAILSPPLIKMFFVSLWFALALALYLINRGGRDVVEHIDHYSVSRLLALFAVGIVGGIVSGLTGSGLDVLTFALMTMVFHLSESIATPTSVVVMASNAIAGVALRILGPGVHPEAIVYWWSAVPVVVIGAPVGAWYIKNKSRDFILYILYTAIAVQFVGALMIVPQTTTTLAIVVATILLGALSFLAMNRLAATQLTHASQEASH